MKQFKTVFLFEFKELINKKSLIISTIIISLLTFGITFAPRVIDAFTHEDEDIQDNDINLSLSYFEDKLIVSENKEVLETLKVFLQDHQDVTYLDNTAQAYKEIEEENYEVAFVLDSLDTYTEVKYDSDLMMEYYFYDVLEAINKKVMATELGIDLDSFEQVNNININVEHEALGKNMIDGLAIGFVMLIALYMLILLFGQQVATSVAREKDNRTMELLITSTNPKQLILGKVFAAGLVGIFEVMIIMFAGFVGLMINKSTFPPELLEVLGGAASWDVVLIYVIFSLSGYLLYLFLFAALGSLVSKVEDVGSSIAPITIVFVVAYLIAINGMQAPDSAIVKAGSYIPFISLFTTPIRYMLTSVKPFEIITSLSLMIFVSVLIAQLSIYIYRKGSLNYGNKLKISKILKDGFKKEA